jgi:DNA-binding protein Fis
VESLADMEKRHIVAVLQLLKGNKTRTASALGIAASTLYEKIKRYNLDV